MQLKAKYNTGSLDEFPGKFWFSSLSAQQLYERRVGLEHYLHSVCQDKVIGTSDTLKEFLIAIQKVCLLIASLLIDRVILTINC